ncbi:MAG TPA: threonine synthase [Thermoplasmata archaeon]|nr:threonine synthase [Thermoplasmata archaeon]
MFFTHLECSECGERHDGGRLQTVCVKCDHALLARYDLEQIKENAKPRALQKGAANLWRWAIFLPVRDERYRVTLGEGSTPLLDARRIDEKLGLRDLHIKEEGLNPTGSFKSRGMCVAVSRAVELGVKDFAVPTAGNAGVALAAYVARAGARAHVFVPEDAPQRVKDEMRRYDAEVIEVAGLISDAGRVCSLYVENNKGVMDVSTLKEPYRVEGKKTMGLEIAADLGWSSPDVVVYPAGGGTGVIGVWKAFKEMAATGLTSEHMPRILVVQAEGCAPIVKALKDGREECEMWQGAKTSAAGLRVPKPFADRLILKIVRETKGDGVTVTEEEIETGVGLMAMEGVNASPEGGAAMAGLRKLVDSGAIGKNERVVVFNTGSGLAY